MQYVEKYLLQKHKASRYSGASLGMNQAYLGQLFKKETGMLFCQYVNNKRLQNAKRLLLRTDLVDLSSGRAGRLSKRGLFYPKV